MSWSDLLFPILLSTGLVFVASSVIHMVLQIHNPDYRAFGNEDEVRAAINKGSPGPGQYILPHCTDPKEGAKPEMVAKFEEGPVAVLFLKPTGQMQLGPFLLKWVGYVLVVSAVVGYVALAAFDERPEYLAMFQITGVTAWLAYSWAGPADAIWMGKPWKVTFKFMVDGLVYALLTAGSFAWLLSA